MAKLTQILILFPQALHLTLALRTALGLGLAQAASDKVLAASISSSLCILPVSSFRNTDN